jgi:UDP-N-acetylglucosamine--N-acetylmuramyl-(pentapeptide) pyrophosphoryl-undecaprenol N-acetylglucosamine transferase
MKRVMLAGGGTGGHIYPALAIGEALQSQFPGLQVQLVGAQGGMEERLFAQSGFPFECLWISGLHRQPTLKNLARNISLPFKLAYSRLQIRQLFKRFQPEVVIGTGGYASYPALSYATGVKGMLSVLFELNAHAGLTNRILGDKVNLVLLGNEAAASAFPPVKTQYTGNPVRASLANGNKMLALSQAGFTADKPVILAMGGSLGARSINQALLAHINLIAQSPVQLYWQCGANYYDILAPLVSGVPNIRLVPFIDQLASVYAMADLVVARAGAGTLAELLALKKPAILVPSPNVADDHQTVNAQSLIQRKLAWTVPDVEAQKRLVPMMLELSQQPTLRASVIEHLEQLAPESSLSAIVAAIHQLYVMRHG